jgi:glycolate oxidase FAD binding subunit
LLDFFFKLKPIPTAQNTVIVALSELSRVREIMNRIVRSSLTPMAVELLNPKAAAFLNAELDLTRQKDCYLLVFLFGDVQRSVEWQVGHVEELVQDLVSEGIKITEATGQQTLWQWIREDLPWMERTGANVKLKVNSLPSQLTDILSRLEGLGNELGAQLWIKSHAGNGIVRAFLNMENSNPIIQRFSRKLEELRSFLKPSRGTAVLEAAPEPFKQLIDVWGYEFKDKTIMRRIRERFDGGQVLNPGRFVV